MFVSAIANEIKAQIVEGFEIYVAGAASEKGKWIN
jgi:hypothetical protein